MSPSIPSTLSTSAWIALTAMEPRSVCSPVFLKRVDEQPSASITTFDAKFFSSRPFLTATPMTKPESNRKDFTLDSKKYRTPDFMARSERCLSNNSLLTTQVTGEPRLTTNSLPEGEWKTAPLISFSMTSRGKRNPNRSKPATLRWPAQCLGAPISLCSSQTKTSAPSLAAVKAEYEPQGPPPTTMTSVFPFTSLSSYVKPLIQV